MPVAEQTDWLDGPRFVAWLKEHGLVNVKLQLGSRSERRLQDWKRGSAASVYTADRALVALGLHLSEVPADLYVPSPKGPPTGKVTPELRREILHRSLELKETPQAVANALGVDHKTVRRHVELARAAG